jgi:hypothetical protein
MQIKEIHKKLGVSVRERSQPKGVKSKMGERKSRRGVNL